MISHFLTMFSFIFYATTALATSNESTKVSYVDAIAPLQKLPGFVDIYSDTEHSKIWLSIHELNISFLLVSSIPYGLGSNDIGIDRGLVGETKVVHFEKHGARVFLVQENTHFIGSSSNPDERQSVVQAFAAAVLWSGDIQASNDSTYLIDFSSFLTSDQHGISTMIAAAKQGQYQVDEKRSTVLVDNARNFPDNTELDALLAFNGPGSGDFVRDVAADPTSLLLHQHISLVRAPSAGFHPRPFHPGSGGFSTSFYDFSTPLSQSLEVRYQLRHRLEKTNPDAIISPVKKPIVYYVDRGAPEPVRSALIEGASWWKTAFEKAGFANAYRVELLPEGVDPMDIRYNVIQWVHRATRGWSFGSAVADPRTGEIIKGSVILGSQRIRQDIMIAESLLAPYGKNSDPALKNLAEKMALERIKQLAAHEVGHTLGFEHNFSASRLGNGSVMDYPHPILQLNKLGAIDLTNAYGQGVGPWDDFIIQHAYGQYKPDEEANRLAQLRASAKTNHLTYISDQDSRPAGAMHPDGLLWDFGPDTLQTYDQLIKIRHQALAHFSFDVLPDERQSGEIEARLVPIYLLHRYQLEAVARLLGGASYEYSLAGDVRSGQAKAGTIPVPAVKQRQALQRLADSLTAEQLGLPSHVLDIMTPQSVDYSRHREYFASRMNSAFDALSAVEAGAAQTCTFLLDPERFNRLAWQHARNPDQPGVDEVIQSVLTRTWKRQQIAVSIPAGETVQLAANWVILNALLDLLNNEKLHPSTNAELSMAIDNLKQWLINNPGKGTTASSRKQAAELIQRMQIDRHNVKLAPLPVIPPGGPI